MGEVVRLTSASAAPLPHPASVELMEIPPEDRDQPHVFFKRVFVRLMIAAERACGAKWLKSLLYWGIDEIEKRVAFGADLGRK